MNEGNNSDFNPLMAACFASKHHMSDLRKEWMAEYGIGSDSEVESEVTVEAVASTATEPSLDEELRMAIAKRQFHSYRR